MLTIAYVSTAAKLFNDQELEQILKESRTWNQSVGITGLLLYKNGNFMQFLEGPKDAVLHILGKIKSDPRHHSMIILLQQEHREREFALWSMGFERIVSMDIPAPAGFSDLWELPFTSEQFLTNPTRAIEFLLVFKDQAVHPLETP